MQSVQVVSMSPGVALGQIGTCWCYTIFIPQSCSLTFPMPSALFPVLATSAIIIVIVINITQVYLFIFNVSSILFFANKDLKSKNLKLYHFYFRFYIVE